MIDKELFRLLGNNKKYIFMAVALQLVGLLGNVSITACICWAVQMLIDGAEPTGFLLPFAGALVGVIVRYIASRLTGDIRDTLGRCVKKDLREKTYNKIVKLGVRSTDGMSMAGLTQVAMEGVEQLDLYYTSYIPQFFYAMLAPMVLFCICVGIEWRVAVVLLACVPLIPVSIVVVSKYAKRIFANSRLARANWKITMNDRVLLNLLKDGTLELYVGLDAMGSHQTAKYTGTYSLGENDEFD